VNDDREWLTFMLECIERIDGYIDGDVDRFVQDDVVHDAVLRRLEILTDAASHLSEALRERHPEIDWSGITGFRNVLAHAYRRVDVESALRVIETGLPELHTVVDAELGRVT